MSDWRKTTLGEFISLQRGHDLPSRERRPGTVPVIGSGGVVGRHDISIVRGPGITIGRAANLGIPVLSQSDFWPLNTTLYVTDFKGNDVNFVYYFFKSLDLTGFNSGSVQPMLNRNYIRNLPVSVPEPTEQRRIGRVLSTLDAKIAANDRINATLLALGEVTYQLHQDNPGWREIQLRETADWYSGGTPPTSEPDYWGGDVPWISALSLKSPWIADSDRKVTPLGVENGTRLVPPGTVIFVVRGSSLKDEFRVGVTQRHVAFGQDCKALVPKEGIDSDLLFYAIRTRTNEVLDLVDETSIGAGRLNTDLIGGLVIRVPGTSGNDVATALGSINRLAAIKQDENKRLYGLRDSLLPRLISGGIKVQEVEGTAQEVV